MEVKNVTQTLKAQASIFLSVPVSQELVKAPQDAEHREELKKLVSPTMKEQLKPLGVDLPSDLVPLSLDLGTLIFDAIYSVKTPPDAPLLKALFEKDKQGMAERLTQKTFELKTSELEDLKMVMSDNEMWKKVRISAYTNEPKTYYNFTYVLANSFTEVLNACLEICMPGSTKKPAAAKTKEQPAAAKTKKKK